MAENNQGFYFNITPILDRNSILKKIISSEKLTNFMKAIYYKTHKEIDEIPTMLIMV